MEGASGHFLFDGLRLALLRPSYRGRRAGVDSFRFLRLLMVAPSLGFQGRTMSATEGSVLVETTRRSFGSSTMRAPVAPMLERNDWTLRPGDDSGALTNTNPGFSSSAV